MTTVPRTHVHTEGNAVPPLDPELDGVLEDLDGIHAGIDLIRDGMRLIALDRLDLPTTQLLAVTLAGSADGTDVLTALGHLIVRLTNPDSNPALRTLTFDAQKHTQLAGERLLLALSNRHLHQHAANASGAIHTD
jgi:hypothetical protein